MMTNEVGEVLVVDDEAINREMLKGLLQSNGHQVEFAADGEEALESVRTRIPDCILLDLEMPRMGGVEVCRRLKADAHTRMIPIIVITASHGSDSRLEAIAAGADDFLTKPYAPEEVRLRVRSAIETKRLFDRVEDDLRRLRSLEETKDTLTHMMIHDLKQPLTAIKAYGDLLAMRLEKAGDEADFAVAQKIGSLVDSMVSMVSLILDITRLEEGKLPLHPSEVDLNVLIAASVEEIESVAATRGIRIDLKGGPGRLTCDPNLVGRIAENLLSNAVKYSPDNGVVSVLVEDVPGAVNFSVSDHGPGIPKEYHSMIFEKFGQVEMGRDRKKYSSGLGLAFCKLACEAHGGSISVESESGLGSTFSVRLPQTQ